MKKKSSMQVVIIGSGNVAWHLAWVLTSLTSIQVSVYNHKASKQLKRFKNELGSATGVGLNSVPGDADVYFICVSDRAIRDVASQLAIRNPKAILAHTSGSASISELGEALCAKAVFYPLQSFSADGEIHWKEVPILLETDKEAALVLKKLANKISNRVLEVNEMQRLHMHLAAVLVNNFTNALYVAASDFLLKKGSSDLSFDLLQPLIQQTTAKIQIMDPRAAQTGPAKRGDKVVMKKHLDLLKGHDELKKLYKHFSKLIKKQQG